RLFWHSFVYSFFRDLYFWSADSRAVRSCLWPEEVAGNCPRFSEAVIFCLARPWGGLKRNSNCTQSFSGLNVSRNSLAGHPFCFLLHDRFCDPCFSGRYENRVMDRQCSDVLSQKPQDHCHDQITFSPHEPEAVTSFEPLGDRAMFLLNGRNGSSRRDLGERS